MTTRDDHRTETMETPSSGRYPFNLDLVFRRRLGRMLLVFLLAVGALPLAMLGLFSYLVAEQDLLNAFSAANLSATIIAATVVLTALGSLFAAAILSHRIIGPLENLSHDVSLAAQGRFADALAVNVADEIGELARAVAELLDHLKTASAQHEKQIQFMSGLTRLHGLIGGEQDLEKLNLNTLEFLSQVLDLSRADIYIVHEDAELRWQGRFPGLPGPEEDPTRHPGKRRAADALREKTPLWFQKIACDKPAKPVSAIERANLITLPLRLRQTGLGALDLEKTERFTASDGRFAETAARVIAVALNGAILRRQEKSLLERSREQAAALRHREADLKAKTHELERQALTLQTAEEALQLKQLELEAANAQMTKNAADLEANMAVLEKQNQALHKAHRELAQKARQLEISNQYKSEFLANMSHELRTPLNSILLLSRLLLENKEANLRPKQSEFIRTIYSAGEDLLNLINEILDLTKVESGKMEVRLSPARIRDITRSMLVTFSPLAEQSRIVFDIRVAPDVPEELITDRKRLEQIIKNFLSNAFKFTPEGSIRLEIAVTRGEGRSQNGGRNETLTIGVADTGIGIPAAKQEMVFEAFQQVDGSHRRKYGGTGLGLSISRELARILGGEIRLESEDGVGSRFTLYLPLTTPENEPAIAFHNVSDKTPATPPELKTAGREEISAASEGPDRNDYNRLPPGDACVLIVDTDADTIAPIKRIARRKGYKALVAAQVSTGLHYADYYLPAAIFLNPELPSENGWKLVSRLKANPKSRHIPVFAVSRRGDAFESATRGAAGHLARPATPANLETTFGRIEEFQSMKQRRILVAAPDRKRAKRIADTVAGFGLRAVAVTTAEDARAVLGSEDPHAVIVHPLMVARGGHEFLAGLKKNPMPVFQYSGSQLKAQFKPDSGPYADLLNIRPIDTPDQLLTALVSGLHLPPENLNQACRVRLTAMDNHVNSLKGRSVLLVDDDMRTVFAVSNVLEDLGVEVVTGKTGKESLDKLSGFPDIDLILMDVIISGVDGYKAMRQIREEERYTNLPIIALTAKAMRGDRAKCIRAGADDYLPKPVNPDKLTSMLKVWFQLK